MLAVCSFRVSVKVMTRTRPRSRCFSLLVNSILESQRRVHGFGCGSVLLVISIAQVFDALICNRHSVSHLKVLFTPIPASCISATAVARSIWMDNKACLKWLGGRHSPGKDVVQSSPCCGNWCMVMCHQLCKHSYQPVLLCAQSSLCVGTHLLCLPAQHSKGCSLLIIPSTVALCKEEPFQARKVWKHQNFSVRWIQSKWALPCFNSVPLYFFALRQLALVQQQALSLHMFHWINGVIENFRQTCERTPRGRFWDEHRTLHTTNCVIPKERSVVSSGKSLLFF